MSDVIHQTMALLCFSTLLNIRRLYFDELQFAMNTCVPTVETGWCYAQLFWHSPKLIKNARFR